MFSALEINLLLDQFSTKLHMTNMSAFNVTPLFTCILLLNFASVSIASRADRTRTMKKDKRELGKLRLLISITLASICV